MSPQLTAQSFSKLLQHSILALPGKGLRYFLISSVSTNTKRCPRTAYAHELQVQWAWFRESRNKTL